ncbi:MAG TPA: MotA/TolQ/ExbB proton channel family protein [Acidaminococcaceae bacterium]|jgi:biopolymer transport protein ExbB|nr:MotA/TolQ/ExbB proton channel family protein [Acidaminococcaceae bacterium]
MFANLLDTFQRGGYVMYPILLCSIFCIAIAAERILFYRARSAEPGFLRSLAELLQQKQYDQAHTLAEHSRGDCAGIASFYLGSHGLSEVETRANLMMDTYEENLMFLSIIITMSPLLGLLGTIVGIIKAFKVFDLRAGQPFAITAGIGEALIATAFGLIVAILALAFYALLKHRANQLSRELMHCCSLLEEADAGLAGR